MNQIWKISTIILAILVIILAFMYYNKEGQFSNGVTSIDGVVKPDNKFLQMTHPFNSGEANQINKENETTIKFSEDIYDFDTIKSGTTISRQLQFVNTGNKPFFIQDIRVSCGCTVPVYTKEPVPPGKTGFFSIDFDSKNKTGFSMNKLTIYGNLPNNEISTYFKVYIKE